MVHYRTGSLETKRTKTHALGGVHYRTGSLES